MYPKRKNDFRVYIPIENKQKIYFIVIRQKSASIKMLADFTFFHSLFSPTVLPFQGSLIIPKLSVVTVPDERESPFVTSRHFPTLLETTLYKGSY